MKTKEVELIDGLEIGGELHKTVVLRAVTAGDLIDAAEESEKLVRTDDGYELVSSPALVSQHVLCRQIVSIGSFTGAVTLSVLKRMSGVDLSLLHEASNELSNLTVIKAAKEISNRGRSDQPGGPPD